MRTQCTIETMRTALDDMDTNYLAAVDDVGAMIVELATINGSIGKVAALSKRPKSTLAALVAVHKIIDGLGFLPSAPWSFSLLNRNKAWLGKLDRTQMVHAIRFLENTKDAGKIDELRAMYGIVAKAGKSDPAPSNSADDNENLEAGESGSEALRSELDKAHAENERLSARVAELETALSEMTRERDELSMSLAELQSALAAKRTKKAERTKDVEAVEAVEAVA